jgi:hypothetical protein
MVTILGRVAVGGLVKAQAAGEQRGAPYSVRPQIGAGRGPALVPARNVCLSGGIMSFPYRAADDYPRGSGLAGAVCAL